MRRQPLPSCGVKAKLLGVSEGLELYTCMHIAKPAVLLADCGLG